MTLNQKLSEMADAYDHMADRPMSITERNSIAFKAGFRAALELPEVKALITALEQVKEPFDCLHCEMQVDKVCTIHLQDNIEIAKKALSTWKAFKEGK